MDIFRVFPTLLQPGRSQASLLTELLPPIISQEEQQRSTSNSTDLILATVEIGYVPYWLLSQEIN